jgi:hypothetical protein
VLSSQQNRTYELHHSSFLEVQNFQEGVAEDFVLSAKDAAL